MRDYDVIVVIATSMNRTDLLIERSLASVYAQNNIDPICIYIVDDNKDKGEFEKIRSRVKEFRKKYFSSMFPLGVPQGHFHTCVMRNSRTKGRSGAGAWNTAAMHAYINYARGRKTYLAFLDDDDMWHEDYLCRVGSVISGAKGFVACVVTAFFRYEKNNKIIVECKKNDLSVEVFFVGNPGWQGSNTFVELTTFWKSGGYDESMESTHDRDFAIRFLDVCKQNNYSVNTVSEPLMSHYAHDETRVTTCFEKKRQGLDIFYHKYKARMSRRVLVSSLTRAKNLFDYDVDRGEQPNQEKSVNFLDFYKGEAPVKIVFGVVSSDERNVKLQISSLAKQLALEPQFLGCCEYVVLTNCVDDFKISEMIRRQVFNGLRTRCIDIAEQRIICDSFPFRQQFESESLERKSIAHSRSFLHYCCGSVAGSYVDDCVVVILDDDLVFESLVCLNDQVTTVQLNFLGKISRVWNSKQADVLISRYTDAPPLPFYSSMRTQLIDIHHTLGLFAEEDHSDIKKGGGFGISNIYSQVDYYYDLSSVQFGHLENPVPWQGVDIDSVFGTDASLVDFLNDICCLESEANITRPLLFDEAGWRSLAGESSYRRGGIAIYLNLKLLNNVPNLSPNILLGGVECRARRSDFIASMAMEEFYGARVNEVVLPLRHNRRKQNRPCYISSNKLVDDVVGLCFYRTFRCWLLNKNASDKFLKAHFDHEVRGCFGKLKVNNLRIVFLLEKLELVLLNDFQSLKRIKQSMELTALTKKAAESVRRIQSEFSKRRFNQQIRMGRKSIRLFDVVREIKLIYQCYAKISKKHHSK